MGAGVAIGGGRGGWPVTLSIGAQNVPEGLIVAVAFLAAGQTKTTALLVTFATGLVEPLGAMIGFAAVQLVAGLMPAALAFAAGAMLYVVSHEIIPESHREGRSAVATFGLMLGVLLMLQFDAWLGSGHVPHDRADATPDGISSCGGDTNRIGSAAREPPRPDQNRRSGRRPAARAWSSPRRRRGLDQNVAKPGTRGYGIASRMLARPQM